jgi:hypothetical protein
MPHSVTLSRSEGSLSLGREMLPCAQHDSIVSHAASRGVTLSRSEGSLSLGTEMLPCAQHDSIVSHAASRGVTLSRSEGSLSLGTEMLPCAQHDHAPLNILLLYNIRSFLEEIEFSTERERAYRKKWRTLQKSGIIL